MREKEEGEKGGTREERIVFRGQGWEEGRRVHGREARRGLKSICRGMRWDNTCGTRKTLAGPVSFVLFASVRPTINMLKNLHEI